MSVRFEWDVELVTDDEHEDIEDHHHCDTYAQAMEMLERGPGEGYKQRVVLVRDDDHGRSWAYMEDGKLPRYFLDAMDTEVALVPRKFHAEVA